MIPEAQTLREMADILRTIATQDRILKRLWKPEECKDALQKGADALDRQAGELGAAVLFGYRMALHSLVSPVSEETVIAAFRSKQDEEANREKARCDG